MKSKYLNLNTINSFIKQAVKLPGGYKLASLAVWGGFRYLGVKMKKLSLYGLKISYLEAGKGPHLILLHGLGSSSLAWSFNLGELSKYFHIIAPDQIGFGQSDKPLISYRISILSDYLYELLSHLKVSPIILVGNSLGGWIAAHFTLTHPELVTKLVLVDSAGYAPEHSLSDYEKLLLNAVTFTSMRDFFQKIFFNPQLINENALKIRLKEKLSSSEPFVIDRLLESVEKRLDVLDYRLSAIKIPTLIIWGKDDPIFSVEYALRFHREISGSKLIIFDQCGHVPQIELPDRFNQELLKFIQ